MPVPVPASAPAAHRPAAWPRLGLLAAAVLLLHAGLAGHWQHPDRPAARQPESRQLAVRLLPLLRPATPAAVQPVGEQGATPALALTAPGHAAPPDAPAEGLAAVPLPGQAAAGPTGARPPAAQSQPDLPAATRPADPADLRPPVGPQATDAAGEPPPVYPTLPPAPAVLRYVLQHGGRAGEAVLTWRPDGPRYLLSFAARLDPGPGPGTAPPALIEQASQGGFDAAGLAPERFTDRRRGRGWQAANFQRESGRISFSGPSVEYPVWPGVQDRLSWLVQLVAIQAAATAPLAEITLWVVDARGGAEHWRFAAQGDGPVETPWGWVPARHWQRQPDPPDRLDSQRVDVWLAPGHGFWPVQLRLATLRTGDETLWRLAADPTPR